MHVTQEASEIDAMREAAWNEDRLGQEAELRRVGQNQVPFKEFRALCLESISGGSVAFCSHLMNPFHSLVGMFRPRAL